MQTTAQAANRRGDELGRRGEDLAAEYLAGTGLVLLSRNWRCRDGEVDLIATDGDRLVYISHRFATGVRVLAAVVRDGGLTAEEWEHQVALRRRLAATAMLTARPGR
jgi:hypothetical protein